MNYKLKYLLISSSVLTVLQLANTGMVIAEPLEERPAVVVKVPAEIRKYKLRIGGKSYTPNESTLQVLPYGRSRKMYVELLDGDNRTVYQGFRKYDADALAGMSKRQFSVDLKLGLGAVQNINLSRIYSENGVTFQAVSAQWQPSILGLALSTGSFQSYSCYFREPCGKLKFAINNLGINLEAAPFTGGKPFFQRLHVALNAGLSSIATTYLVKEKDIGLSDKDQSTGRYAQFEFRIPVVSKIWIDIQHGVQEIPVELKLLKFKEKIMIETHALGVRYAF